MTSFPGLSFVRASGILVLTAATLARAQGTAAQQQGEIPRQRADSIFRAVAWQRADSIYRLAVDSTYKTDRSTIYLLDEGVMHFDADGRGSRTYHAIVEVLKDNKALDDEKDLIAAVKKLAKNARTPIRP